MPEKSKNDSESEYLPITREELDRELRAEKGDEWVDQHKEMLDAQWDYIDSL